MDGKLVSLSSKSLDGRDNHQEGAWALVSSEGGVVAVMDLTSSLPDSISSAFATGRKSEVTLLDANTNIVFSRSVMPTILSSHAGNARNEWLVTGIFALPSRVGQKGVTKDQWVNEWKKRPTIPEEILKIIQAQ